MGTDRGRNTKKVGGARKPVSKISTALILVEKYLYKKTRQSSKYQASLK